MPQFEKARNDKKQDREVGSCKAKRIDRLAVMPSIDRLAVMPSIDPDRVGVMSCIISFHRNFFWRHHVRAIL